MYLQNTHTQRERAFSWNRMHVVLCKAKAELLTVVELCDASALARRTVGL